MFSFSGRYPVTRANWPYMLGGILAALLAAGLADAALSRYATAWPEPWPWFFGIATNLGEAGWILVPALKLCLLCAALAFIVHDRLPRLALLEQTQLWGFVFLGVGAPSLVANLIKRAIGRGRPEHLDQYGTLSFRSFANDWSWESFPSGHTTTIFALAMVVGFLWPRWFIPALLVAVLVGVSRIALGMHYPSDVAGGAVCGILVAYLVRLAFASRGWLFVARPDGLIERRHFPFTREALGRQRIAR